MIADSVRVTVCVVLDATVDVDTLVPWVWVAAELDTTRMSYSTKASSVVMVTSVESLPVTAESLVAVPVAVVVGGVVSLATGRRITDVPTLVCELLAHVPDGLSALVSGGKRWISEKELPAAVEFQSKSSVQLAAGVLVVAVEESAMTRPVTHWSIAVGVTDPAVHAAATAPAVLVPADPTTGDDVSTPNNDSAASARVVAAAL